MPPRRPSPTEIPTTITIDLANEQTLVMGCIARPAESEPVVRRVGAGEFLDPRHVALWTAFRAAANQRAWYEPAVVRRLLSDSGSDQKLGAYLGSLEEKCREVEEPDLRRCEETLRWDARRHATLREGVPELARALAAATMDPTMVRAAARRLAAGLDGVVASDVVTPEQIEVEYSAELRRRARAGVHGLGYPDFDGMLGRGFAPGLTSVVTGVSSAGKSSVLVNWAMALARLGRRVAYCAWEETHTDLADIIAAAHCDVSYSALQQGRLEDVERRKAIAAVRYYTNTSNPGWIRFVKNPFTRRFMSGAVAKNIDNFQVIAGLVAEAGADVIVYDMLERSFGERHVAAVEMFLEMTQGLHKEYGVHGIIGAQTNLEVVERQGKRAPSRADVKGVKRIVEIADLFFIVSREGQFFEGDDQDNTLDTRCEKQKHGRSPWTVRWDWRGDRKMIANPKIHRAAEGDQGRMGGRGDEMDIGGTFET